MNGVIMRRQSWLIILLSVLVLLKGSGLYAMVHCQNMPQHSDMSTTMQMASSADVTADTNSAIHANASAAQHTTHHADTDADNVSATSHCQDPNTPEHCYKNQLQVQDQHSASTCQACDHCCTIHGMAFPATLVLSQQDSHDKVLQFSYFHTSVFIPTQKRPPKAA